MKYMLLVSMEYLLLLLPMEHSIIFYGDTAVSIASSSIAIDTEPSTGNDSTATAMMTAQVYSSQSSSFCESSNDHVAFPTVATETYYSILILIHRFLVSW